MVLNSLEEPVLLYWILKEYKLYGYLGNYDGFLFISENIYSHEQVSRKVYA